MSKSTTSASTKAPTPPSGMETSASTKGKTINFYHQGRWFVIEVINETRGEVKAFLDWNKCQSVHGYECLLKAAGLDPKTNFATVTFLRSERWVLDFRKKGEKEKGHCIVMIYPKEGEEMPTKNNEWKMLEKGVKSKATKIIGINATVAVDDKPYEWSENPEEISMLKLNPPVYKINLLPSKNKEADDRKDSENA